MRGLLLEPKATAALLSLQRPLADLQAETAAAFAAHLTGASVSELMQEKLTTAEGGGAPATAAAHGRSEAPVRWYGIAALPKDALMEGLAEALSAVPEEVAGRIRAGRPEYPVTLWHVEESAKLGAKNAAVRAELAASVGQQAVVEVLTIDWNDSVVAAQVRDS